MDNVKLIKPCKAYLESYLEACREFKASPATVATTHDPDKYKEWKDTIIQRYEDHSKGVNLPEGYVPCTTYWLVDGENFIGRGSIRHCLNDFLQNYGGHIGYYIRPTYWNKGYGTLQLKQLLERAHELGIKKALITCDTNNISSARVMEKNGAVRLDETEITVDSKVRKIYRYEVET